MKFTYLDEDEVTESPARELKIEPPQRSQFSELITELFDTLQRSGPTAVMVTSPHRRAGVSFVCSNIALELALQGESVLLVDAHALLAVRESMPQSVTVLCRRVGPPSLWVLGMNDVLGRSANPERLTSSQVNAKLRELERAFTYVLIDAPALSIGMDANILAALVYGTLIVARANHTCNEEVKRACRILRAVGGLVLGSVFNAH
jgi:polysaccharide biosynthesis transport protein